GICGSCCMRRGGRVRCLIRGGGLGIWRRRIWLVGRGGLRARVGISGWRDILGRES
ncbi:hypothetical protein LTS18_014943, partial [Coniosporium uncinatum]